MSKHKNKLRIIGIAVAAVILSVVMVYMFKSGMAYNIIKFCIPRFNYNARVEEFKSKGYTADEIEQMIEENNHKLKYRSEIKVWEGVLNDMVDSDKENKYSYKNGETPEEVFITKTGTKYHCYKDCRYLSNAKGIYSISIDEALEQKYTPCKGCGF